eukprot:COSAG01_NODE_2281_length_8005_cov_4.513408_11_plen_55_part_00
MIDDTSRLARRLAGWRRCARRPRTTLVVIWEWQVEYSWPHFPDNARAKLALLTG